MSGVTKVKCKLCGVWVSVNRLQEHIDKYHSGSSGTITPASVFGVR